eukprot:TRINITY_DN4641_c0_g1_i17.p1 TRINITY_DN4641_c0_g1~~TRINITY_DN4641_c0_g1_i17.p1  ORF type:complete len:215 (-),score=57.99 TRINITY_DN4641_c0_g1_i17:121-765(-)
MDKDSLAQHMKTCAGYQNCKWCCHSFLKNSLLAHEPRCQSSAACTGCNARMDKDSLAQHMKTCAGYQNCNRVLKSSLLAHEPRCQSSAVCTGCNVRMNKDSLAEHMKTCAGHQNCKWCCHRFLKSSLPAHEPRCQSSAVCTGCNVRMHKDSLAQHMNTLPRLPELQVVLPQVLEEQLAGLPEEQLASDMSRGARVQQFAPAAMSACTRTAWRST